MATNLEEIVARQITDWRLRHPSGRDPAAWLPTVAISHTHGAGGTEVATRVADQLGFRLYDRELVEMVAADARVSSDLVAALDDEVQTSLGRHIDGLFAHHEIEPAEHVRHLVRVVSTIAAHGGVVIVGRAAAIFLDRATTVAVRIDAPFTLRLTRLQAATGLGDHEARARIVRTDDDRADFVKKHFKVTGTDPLLYDLALNTARMDFAAAATTIAALTRAKFPKLVATQPT